MNTERLLRLATFLENDVPRNRFRMDRWIIPYWNQGCGMAGCAIGWACQIPEFVQAGFSMMSDPHYVNSSYQVPTYNGKTEYSAVREFFDIEQDTAVRMFGSMSYTQDDPVLVANRIRFLVSESIDRGSKGATP